MLFVGEPRWLDEREARLWQGYIGLKLQLESELERRLVRDGGLSGAEFTLLVPLSEAPGGLLRARDLGRMVGWERSRISHQVGRMEKRGLVVREECAADAGRAAIVGAAPQHVEAVRSLFFDVLTDDEVDVLGAAFERVLARLPIAEE
jgi:DNA-binding MarR family transcriptional regulator